MQVVQFTVYCEVLVVVVNPIGSLLVRIQIGEDPDWLGCDLSNARSARVSVTGHVWRPDPPRATSGDHAFPQLSPRDCSGVPIALEHRGIGRITTLEAVDR